MTPLEVDRLDELRRTGLTVVPGLIPAETVAAMRAEAEGEFASVADVVADPSRHRVNDAGLGFRTFPYRGDALNLAPFDEGLLDFAQAAFDGRPPFLTQSIVRASYPLASSRDQHLHRDYTDNGLLYPSEDPAFTSLAVLVYLTDVDLDRAPLHVVPHGIGRDRAALPRERSRDDDPALYAAEVPVVGPAGTGIIYQHSAWHRGSRNNSDDGWRLAMHLVYRPAGCEWISFTAFGTRFDGAEAIRCMERLTPRQRSVLGVPLPGHPYWTPTTVAGVLARYPNMDMDPYR